MCFCRICKQACVRFRFRRISGEEMLLSTQMILTVMCTSEEMGIDCHEQMQMNVADVSVQSVAEYIKCDAFQSKKRRGSRSGL